MQRVVWMAVALTAFTACAGPVEIESAPTCVAVLRLGGVTYTIDGPLTQGALVPGVAIGEVSRYVECDDTPDDFQPVSPLQDGESNFLPTGTTLYSVEGFEDYSRLAARPDTVWIFMSGIGSR